MPAFEVSSFMVSDLQSDPVELSMDEQPFHSYLAVRDWLLGKLLQLVGRIQSGGGGSDFRVGSINY